MPKDTTDISSIAQLEAIYGAPAPLSLQKVSATITPLYKTWIEKSKFLVIASVGPHGTDASPRGDDSSVVKIQDQKTIHLPDWMGNNRIDTLRNIVEDGRVSLMLMVTGSQNVVRINGHARLSTDPAACAAFEKRGKTPKCVLVITVHEAYFQCAKAIMRSALWSGDNLARQVPSAGDFLREADQGFDANAYDQGYGDYAQKRMW